MSEKNRVLAIVYQSENNVLVPSTLTMAEAITAHGYNVELVDLSDAAKFQELYRTLASGDVAFAYGLQGVGSQLHAGEQNLWHATRTPFISLHYDHPCYCIGNHIANSPYVMNVYHYQSSEVVFEKYIAPLRSYKRLSASLNVNCFPLPDVTTPFESRPIKFLYLKTGVTLDPYRAHFDSLPKFLRDGAWDQLAVAQQNPNLSLCDLAATLFAPETFFDPDNQVEFWALVKAMDLYLRSKRAIDFVNWLKRQDGAVIIGNGWDGIDKTGARATFKPSLDAMEANALYQQTQFICNTNPYAADMIHERTILGLLFKCAVITDTNAWTDAHMEDTENLIRFDWASSLDTQILPMIQDLEKFAMHGEESRRKTATLFNHPNNAEKLIAFAKQVQTFAG